MASVSPEQVDQIVARFEKAQDRLVLQQSDLSLETLASMVEAEAIDLRPHYQRRDRWSAFKSSALIESFLLNIPVPPIYLAEEEFGTYSVIDGKQRLSAIRAFMRNELRLTHLETFEELDQLRYSDLPEELSNALSIRPYLRVVTLLKQSDPELKYDVFERLNTGGDTLNAQEIRNVAYHGPLNDLIYSTLCERTFLRQQLKIGQPEQKSPAWRKMQDAEYVLRFLTLQSEWTSFSGDLGRSMSRFMERYQHAGKKRLDELESSFDRALGWCERLWGTRAFNRPTAEKQWRHQTLAGMYDAEMVAVTLLSDSELKAVKASKKVLATTRNLFKDPQFEVAVRQGTNTPSRVRYRIEQLAVALKALT